MKYRTPEYHPAFEEYCETIFELAEDDFEVIQARIVERLEVSRPAVSEMIHRLEDAGLVNVADGTIKLTSDGQELAASVVRRHRLAERFLTDVLGLDWTDAHHEAGKWEHVISPDVEDALNRLLGEPTTCPHGNPIPGSSYREARQPPALPGSGRRSVHRQPHPRGAGVHSGVAGVSRRVVVDPRRARHCDRLVSGWNGHR